MAKTVQEIISDLEKGKENIVALRDAATRDVTRLAQHAQELRNAIKSKSTSDDQKRQYRADLIFAESDLSTARRDVEKQTVLIRRIDTEITKLRKNVK